MCIEPYWQTIVVTLKNNNVWDNNETKSRIDYCFDSWRQSSSGWVCKNWAKCLPPRTITAGFSLVVAIASQWWKIIVIDRGRRDRRSVARCMQKWSRVLTTVPIPRAQTHCRAKPPAATRQLCLKRKQKSIMTLSTESKWFVITFSPPFFFFCYHFPLLFSAWFLFMFLCLHLLLVEV